LIVLRLAGITQPFTPPDGCHLFDETFHQNFHLNATRFVTSFKIIELN
jgi:hypothetical protein